MKEDGMCMKIEDIFAPMGDASKSYFHVDNKIIANSTLMMEFVENFNQYASYEQEPILHSFKACLEQVSTNAHMLNSQQPGLIAGIIDLLPQYVHNYLIFGKMLGILDSLLKMSSLRQELVTKAFNRLMLDFHDGRVDSSSLFACVSVVKAYFGAKIQTEKEPPKMMSFHGQRGLAITPLNSKKQTSWIFSHGFTLCLWINIENIKFGNEDTLPKLFTFYSPNHGGLESYFIDNKLFYRMVGPKYTEPSIGSNGLLLGELQPKKWHFICIEHEGIKTFSKSKLVFYHNKNKTTFSMDPPRINASSKTKFIFFDRLYARTSSVCLLPMPAGQTFVEETNKNLASITNLKNPKALIFQLKQNKLYERSGFGYSNDLQEEKQCEINFKVVLPILYLLRFVDQNQFPLFEDFLQLFIFFLRKSPLNQIQANSQSYFKIISELVKQLPRLDKYFNSNSINVLQHIKHTITNRQLLDDYYCEFLWPLVSSKIQITRKQQILELIKNSFTQNVSHFSNLIGLDQMINAIVNLGSKGMKCCEKHYKILLKRFQKELEIVGQYGENELALGYILQIIQLYFQNGKINYATEVYKLCRLLLLKFSPCFTLSLIATIRKIISQRLTEKLNEEQSKKMSKYLLEKKVYLIFLYCIENNFFAQIKAESTKIIYQLLMRKCTQAEETEVSRKISQALWKINQERQQESLVASMTQSALRKRSSILESSIQISEQKKALINLMEDQNEEQFKLVGPQAPQLTNKQKGNKKFNFNFINDTSQPEGLSPEKKHQDIFISEDSIPKVSKIEKKMPSEEEKKNKKGLALTINTDAINQMYTFGGEKGQQIMISEEEEKNELKKIERLAKKCVAAMKKEKYVEEQEKPRFVPPPATTSNKVLMNREKKNIKLQLIQQDEEEQTIRMGSQQTSPHFTYQKSLRSPSSINSLHEENLFALYNSLLECCLGMNYNASLDEQKIKTPSVLYVFFRWIPQTNLEVKFLNDMEIILQIEDNMKAVLAMPEFYDFLSQLIYKALLFQEMGEKTLYNEKLQSLIKKVVTFIFRKDPHGLDKFAFILDWVSAKSTQYHPKCLFFTPRYFTLLILSSIEEQIGMNSTIDQIMTENFQALGIMIQTLRKFLPSEEEEPLILDQYQRVVFQQGFEMINSLAPFFNQRKWADYVVCEKYQLLFKKFFCTSWYKKALGGYQLKTDNQLLYLFNFLNQSLNSRYLQVTAQANYYLRHSFLFSLIQINRSLLADKLLKGDLDTKADSEQLVWQTILLILFCDLSRQKHQKMSNSQFILVFLKNCKFFSAFQIENAVNIVPILQQVKSTLQKISKTGISSGQDLKSSGKGQIVHHSHTNMLQNLLNDYIRSELFDENFSMQNFKLNFNDVWLPSEDHYKKIRSETYQLLREKYSNYEGNNISYIEHIGQIMEEECQRFDCMQVLIECNDRVYRNQFRKIWQELQIYDSIWTHPKFSWQNDILFSKNTFSYERYDPSPFYKLKISNHLSKHRLRYLLKPQLIPPQMVAQYSNKLDNPSKNQINLDRAIMYSMNKLSIGKKQLSWLTDKHDEIQILLPFKKVRLVKTLVVRHGQVGIINDKIVFVGDYRQQSLTHLSIDQFKLKKDKKMFKIWPLEFVKEIFRRRYINRKRAIQIFFINGKSIFLDFYENDWEDFVKKLIKYKGTKCANLIYNGHKSFEPKKIYESQNLLKKWTSYEISNFEYLNEINNLGGRSFKDITQYPVYPWLLVNFSSKFSLANQQNFRDLSLPMGALGSEERALQFEQRYEDMIPDESGNKFHFGTHYSSPGIIYHFLVRISPFSQGGSLLQGGKFDFADRLFFSVSDSYKNATSEYSDVRQLLPQMYTIPEIYLNINKLQFGLMQNKKRVHNVELPEWCRDNPYLYVTKLRRAFQDGNVNKSINRWIDLIFGFKQRGEEAINSLNTFVSITYEDSIDFQSITSKKELISLETQILNFGQTPTMIFSKPHPEKPSITTCKTYNSICDYINEPRTYRPSKNTNLLQLLKQQKQLNPLKQIDRSIIHMKWFKDTSLVFIRRNGEMLFYKWHVNQNNINKAPFQCSIEKQRKVERIIKHNFDCHEYYDSSLYTESFPLEFINSGHQLLLGGLGEGKVVLLDADTGHAVETYQGCEATVCCMRADSKDNFIIMGDVKGNVGVWRITSNHRLSLYGNFSDHTKQITSIFISYELLCFATSSEDGRVFLYNLMTGKKLRVFHHPKHLPISHVLISLNPLPVVVIFCNVESIIYCYSLNGQLIQRIHEKDIEHFISPIVMKDSSGFDYVAYANEHGQTIFRTLPFLDNSKKQVVVKDAVVNRVCASKSGKFVISGCSDGELSVITVPELS